MIVSIIAVSLIIPFVSKYVVGLLNSVSSGTSIEIYVMKSLVFYIIQTGLAVLIVRYVFGYPMSHMGFTLKNWKTSITLTMRFIAIWLILDIVFYFICLNFVSNFDSYIKYYYVEDSNNLLRDFVVGCLFAGVGEEPLFRGLVVLVLTPVVTSKVKIGKVQLPFLALISGFIFMIAHIVYDVSPLRIVRIDYLQLMLTFILGTIWASIFIKTKSLFGPVLAHTLANIIQIMSGYFVAFYVL